MTERELVSLMKDLLPLPRETEWVEFKHDNDNPQEIGEYLSAMSNSATLVGKRAGYIVWGIEDRTHTVLGTSFKPDSARHKSQELGNWLATNLTPRVDFRFHSFDYDGKPLVLCEVPPAVGFPVRFIDTEFIRHGSYKKKLREHPEKERTLWQVLSATCFEDGVAVGNLSARDALGLLAHDKFNELTKTPVAMAPITIADQLTAEGLLDRKGYDNYDVTNLGALLFAKDLRNFPRLRRKAIRVVFYAGSNRAIPSMEQEGIRGYAIAFSGSIGYLKQNLPHSEEIRDAMRVDVPRFPELALRELMANALVHQDLTMTGTGPMVEVFDDRIEITNPGTPLIDVRRFMDSPPRSRNEKLASFMRRIGVCEERGSGIDKVVDSIEIHQLPPLEISEPPDHTKAVLYAPRALNKMDAQERIAACYQHACLLYLSGQKMTNETLRKRLSIDDDNYPMASRVIRDTLDAELIKLFGATSGRYSKYVPYWV